MRRTKHLRIVAIGVLGALVGLLGASTGHAAQPAFVPSDGTVAFSYSRDPAVSGCSQDSEAEVRDLVQGVVHLDPFVPTGSSAPFSLKVEVTKPRIATFRATFSLFDRTGAARGTSTVEDVTCDGAHLKLAASIALLLQPRPAPPASACPDCPEPTCDEACRESVKKELRAALRDEVRAQELPNLRLEARAEAEKELSAKYPPRGDFRAAVSAGAMFAFNFAAEPAPGFWLAGEARSERWALMVEARGTFPTVGLLLADGRSSADVMSVAGLVSPCIRWRWLAGCALVEAGSVWAAGAGVAGSGAPSALVGLGLRARVDVPIGAGLEARLFGDAIGHVVGATAQGQDTTGPGGAAEPAPFAFDAPRKISAFMGLGVARAFD